MGMNEKNGTLDSVRMLRRLAKENMKRVLLTTAALIVLFSVRFIWLNYANSGNGMSGLDLSISLASIGLPAFFFLISNYIMRSGHHSAYHVIYQSFWLILSIYSLGMMFLYFKSANDLTLYCLSLFVFSVIPILSAHEYFFLMVLQSPVILIILYRQSDSANCMMILFGFHILSALISRQTYQSQRKMILLDEKFHTMSITAERDPLTGLYNRRGLDKNVDVVWPYCVRYKSVAALFILDIDHFKMYNDTYGHPKGDICIKLVANAIRKAARRSTDIAARIGGEEFVVFIHDIKEREALLLAERMRGSIEHLEISQALEAGVPNVTVSIGVALAVPSGDTSFADLYERADRALYTAKNSGRNKVVSLKMSERKKINALSH